MKIDYENIKKNIEVYETAKREIPAISQYENGDIPRSTMASIGLGEFASFYDLMKVSKEKEFSLVMEKMTWRKLKPILVNTTNSAKYKKYISNRTEKKFCDIFTTFNEKALDVLLNGGWLRRPTKRRSGSRKADKLDCLTNSIIPIINYLICNEVDIKHTTVYTIKEFRYYTGVFLKLEDVPAREIEITNKVISSIIDIFDNTRIDFRKLNISYIQDTIDKKIRNMIDIPNGTNIKCIKPFGNLTVGKYYKVQSYDVDRTGLRVWIVDDRGGYNWYSFSYFEDMKIHRDDLLSDLLGE